MIDNTKQEKEIYPKQDNTQTNSDNFLPLKKKRPIIFIFKTSN